MSVKSLRGDTIIEVVIAITVFCVISIITIGIMDRDLNNIQGTLELEMARNEIDAQAEALRFIHNSFLSEREYTGLTTPYRPLWKRLTTSISAVDPETGQSGYANAPASISPFEASECSVYYDSAKNTVGEPHNLFMDHAFILNTRDVNPKDTSATIIPANDSTKGLFINTNLYPRIVYTASTIGAGDSDEELTEADILSGTVYNKIARIEGIWVIAVQDETDSSKNGRPEFFDFHIRTCWYAPNHDYPTTIATIIRLYNPEVIKEAK